MGKKIPEWTQKEIANYSYFHTLEETAEKFEVSIATVSKYKKKWKAELLLGYNTTNDIIDSKFEDFTGEKVRFEPIKKAKKLSEFSEEYKITFDTDEAKGELEIRNWQDEDTGKTQIKDLDYKVKQTGSKVSIRASYNEEDNRTKGYIGVKKKGDKEYSTTHI